MFFAPLTRRLTGRVATTFGFSVAGLAFFGVSAASNYGTMAALHAVAGMASGCALSFTHGAIGRSLRPHRLFAIVGMALGVFGVLFMAIAPRWVAEAGGPTLFRIFGGVMFLASAACALTFPSELGETRAHARSVKVHRLDGAVWFGALGVSCMALVQAMMFSFLERIGSDRGFGFEAVSGVLVALGIVNLFPAALAALLERRLPARGVVMLGPFLQAGLALIMTQSAAFEPYAGAAMFFAAVMIFTHTFAFGLLAGLDPTGRAVSATPAMIMIGAAVGPILGGTLVKFFGYGGLGVAAAAIAVLAIVFFARARRTKASELLAT